MEDSMRKKTRPASAFSFLAMIFLALILTYSQPSHAAAPIEGAQALIQSLSDEATALLNNPNAPAEKRVEVFRDLLRKYFASSAIGKWVLGRYWRQATDAERADYLLLFEDYIVYGYVKRFGGYAGEKLKIIRTANTDANTVTVFSEFVRPGGEKPIMVDWRVGSDADRFMITDVVVEGTSLSQTLRSDFASTIHQGGGNVESLLVVLRNKVAQLKTDLGISS
jgi:phospholipid transport system substrate-binding protein